ncbi:MAG: Helix-turn-helix domain [Conexibacter sp.]|nr:Helix-turn-helix domain [Conexibacter sp.]
MTQEQLANEAGIGQAHLSRIENGRHDPSIRMVAKIASALEISVADLMKGV